MSPKLFLCLALLLGILRPDVCRLDRAAATEARANPSAQPAGGRIYTSTNYGFQMVVPDGWTARETQFYIAHYSDGITTINSHRPDLKIQYLGEPGTKTMSQQMQPGEVYITFGYSYGPGGVPMRPDTVGGDLRALLATNRISASHEPDLSYLGLHFFKRGHWWDISAWLREPVTEDNRQKVKSLLASFRFLDAPVENVAWAESLAWNELPEQIRGPEDWFQGWPVTDRLDQRPQYGPRLVVVKKNGDAYTVQFLLNGIGSWKYLVSEDGKVQSGLREIFAVGPPPAQLPSDLPGEDGGAVNAFWIEPYVQVCEALHERTVTWYGEDGRIRRSSQVGDPYPGGGFFSHSNIVEGINEDWSLTLPPSIPGSSASYGQATPDSRVFVRQSSAKSGLETLDFYVHGQRLKTFGPYLPCYPSHVAVLNEDGSAGLLVWKDAAKTCAQVVVFNTNGTVRFQTDCGQNVWSPVVAPDGAGVLLRPNGGTNQNTFIWFIQQGKGQSMDISFNPECIGWVPRSRQSVFLTCLGNKSYRCQIIDWDTGRRLWDVPVPDDLRPQAIGLTPKFVIIAAAQPYPPASRPSTNQPAPEAEWVRTFNAIDVQDGNLAAQWQGQLPHRSLPRYPDHFIWLRGKLFYVTEAEFTELNLDDIRAKKHGWR